MRRTMVNAWFTPGTRTAAGIWSRTAPGIGSVLLPSALVLGLSGCALPPAISIASLAVDAVSYMITEKTVADHALSQFAQQDCALLRSLSGDPVCVDYDIADIAVASGEDEAVDDPHQHLGDADDAEDRFGDVMLASADTRTSGGDEIALLSTASGPDGMGVHDLISPRLAARTTGPGASDAGHWAVPATASEPVPLDVPDIDSRLKDGDLAEPDDGGTFPDLSRSRPIADPDARSRVRAKATGTGGTETFAALSRSSPPGEDVTVDADLRYPSRRAWVRGPAPSAGLYYVIAQSPRWSTTEDMVRRFKDLTPTVISDRLDARATFHVVVGPFARHQTGSVHRQIRHAGIEGADIIHVEPDDWFGLRPAAFVQISENTIIPR